MMGKMPYPSGGWGAFITCLLFLHWGLHIVNGEASISTKKDKGRDGDDSPFQYKFADMLVWSKPIPDEIISFVAESQRQVILQALKECPKKEFFFGLNPTHMSAVTRLKNVLLAQKSLDDWLEIASGLRESVNPYVWIRAVLASVTHRSDLQGLILPPVVEVIPGMFIPGDVLDKLIHVLGHNDTCVKVDESFGVDNGEENALWYFREDIMVNSHHLFWHINYPLGGDRNKQPDRNGELFYFMHHDFLSRYHSERLSSGLAPAQQWDLVEGGTIPLGYIPHLHEGNSGFDWSARPPNVAAQDIPEGNLFGVSPLSLRTRTIQKNRILEGISNGSLIATNGTLIPLNSRNGISILGNVVIANIYSINPNYYGRNGIHNNGHIMTALVMDPANDFNTPPGVMGDTGTSMRDTIFGPYHLGIDEIFRSHKNTLTPYQYNEGEWPLSLEGVTLQSIKVQSKKLPSNELHTYWNQKIFDLSRGLDFGRPLEGGPLIICEKTLDHQDFQYQLQIEATEAIAVNVRLFMGPRTDFDGNRYTLEEQRNLMFILDTFIVQLNEGVNTISRNSTDTPLTIDFNQGLDELESFNIKPWCACGWPKHLLIPKGKEGGLAFDLFAIVTNAKDDQVVQSGVYEEEGCRSAYIYCGLQGNKYPDARPMGYPFDRKFYISNNDNGATLEGLAQAIPNAAMAQVNIVHFDETRYGKRNYGTK